MIIFDLPSGNTVTFCAKNDLSDADKAMLAAHLQGLTTSLRNGGDPGIQPSAPTSATTTPIVLGTAMRHGRDLFAAAWGDLTRYVDKAVSAIPNQDPVSLDDVARSARMTMGSVKDVIGFWHAAASVTSVLDYVNSHFETSYSISDLAAIYREMIADVPEEIMSKVFGHVMSGINAAEAEKSRT